MNQCNLCEKVYKKKLIVLGCCQRGAESQYKLCTRCIKRCDACPFCRSPKATDLKIKSLIFEIEYMIRLHALMRTCTEQIIFDLGNYLYPNNFGERDEYFSGHYEYLCNRAREIIRDHVLTTSSPLQDILDISQPPSDL